MYEKFVGVDNGVSGTIAILNRDGSVECFTPVKTVSELSYTKDAKHITRIKVDWLLALFAELTPGETRIGIERPMINPRRFVATVSAIRAFEALAIVLDLKGLPRGEVIDSKVWQKALLPKGVSGDDLKTASADIGKKLHPELSDVIDKHGDADGLLIAEYMRRTSVGA